VSKSNEQGTQEINNPKYQGMLVDVLEQLKIDEQQFDWYQDKYNDYNDKNLENKLNKGELDVDTSHCGF
jgi:hypothetical protein